MTTEDLHEVTFIWPRTNAGSVVLTGTFDNWSKSTPLTKSAIGFTGSIKIPWNQTIAYKYIVDGNWSLDDSKPKRVELGGYVNNVYVAPCKPSSPTVPVKAPSEAPVVHLNGTMNGIKTEHAGDASAAQDIPGGTEVGAEIPDQLQPKINGYLKMSEPPQAAPSVQGADKAGDLSIEEGMKSIPADGDGTAELGVDKEEGMSQAEKPKEDEKPLKSVPQSGKEPAETANPTPPTGLTSPKPEQEVSQVASSNGSTTSVPQERKSTPIMSFVPVNVPPEAPPVDGSLLNGTNGVSGEETSTHKPLRPVSKIPQSPTATLEATTSPAEQSAATTGETPVKPEGATTEAGLSQGAAEESPAEVAQTAAEPEEKAIPAVRPATAPAPATQLPQPTLIEVPQPGPTQPVADEKSADIPSTAPPVATPVKEAADTTKTPEPAAVALAPVLAETKPAGKSPSAPSSPTKARFPRVSRESSASEPPQNGIARKRKSTFLEKIKHIFSHEKNKGKEKSKK